MEQKYLSALKLILCNYEVLEILIIPLYVYERRSTMNIILLSGGSGKRLWPLSNEIMSKQFLQLLSAENGKTESMVQRVYRQIKSVDPTANIVISTNQAQKASLHRQLGDDADIVIEPKRRNTFPAILLASAYFYYTKKLNKTDSIIVLPIDVFADETYFTNLFKLEQELKNDTYKLMLMGAKPTYPSEKYGYILPCEYKQDSAMTVQAFKEKPDVKTAEKLLEQGALWNCGLFGFKLSYIIDILQKSYATKNFEDLLCNYDKLTKDSFDYQVVEKEKSIGLIEYAGKWKDLGTWNTLTEEMGRQKIGSNIQISDSCKNTHVLNMLDTPIITLGLKNVVVVASRDGILVSDKTESSYLKPYADNINQRTMYEQRIWGDYRVLDHTTDENNNVTTTKRVHIKKGMKLSYQYHEKITEFWTISKGEGILLLNDEKRNVKRGEVIVIPPLAKHAIQAITDLELIEIKIGNNNFFKNDVVKVTTEW